MVFAGDGTAEMYNSTHAYVDVDQAVVARIYFRNVKVYELPVEPGHAYSLTVKVGRLVLKLPRGVKAYVTVLASGETFEADSLENETVEIRDVPYGLVKVRVVGAITEERAFNFQGGVIEVIILPPVL